jgi:hypothetical protein
MDNFKVVAPTLRAEYLSKCGGYEDIAAIALARDLMQGDPENFKAGYSRENAIIAAEEVFPDSFVDWEMELA